MQHARSIHTLSRSARTRGIVSIGAPGVGKSRLFGRVIGWQDFLLELPQVIIDPSGSTIDNFLDKLVRTLADLPKANRQAVWDRIQYVDMGSKDFVRPFRCTTVWGQNNRYWKSASGIWS